MDYDPRFRRATLDVIRSRSDVPQKQQVNEDILFEVIKQYTKGKLTATEMLNKIFQTLGMEETKEFRNQFK